MTAKVTGSQLIVPVYINEKIVLDMLAIMDDGFSMVSQVNYSEHRESSHSKSGEVGISNAGEIISKLLKIDITGNLNHTGSTGEDENVAKEKVHTNVSLLSKFRSFLVDEKILKTEFDLKKMKIGDFVEVEGELQKNPLIACLDMFLDVFRMAGVFSGKPNLGSKSQGRKQTEDNNTVAKQIKAFREELNNSGTLDFILTDQKGTVVLSAQEKYLANDNVSEILGGRFKILGKVIAVCKDDKENIDLLRKTALSVFPKTFLESFFESLTSGDLANFNFPELKTHIGGPAIIVIPIAIYA